MGHERLGRLYQDGEAIVRQGELGDCMFAVQLGEVEVVSADSGGQEVSLGVLGRGETFGEMAVFQKERRSATVRARGKARVLTIDKRTFLARVQEDPTLAFRTVRSLCERLRRANEEVVELRTRLEACEREDAAVQEARSARPKRRGLWR
jgi:CRP/FNR family cyclic AMP-dependent transcriptional regulator